MRAVHPRVMAKMGTQSLEDLVLFVGELGMEPSLTINTYH